MIQINSALCKAINSVRLRLIYYGRAAVGSDWRGPVPNPYYSRLFYIVSGSATITFQDNQTLTLMPGKWYLLPAGCSFDYACDNQLDHIYFHLKLCDLDEIDLLRNFPTPCALEKPESNPDFFVRNLESSSITDALRVHKAVYEILLSFIDQYGIPLQQKNISPCVTAAIEYIKQHLTAQLSVEEIANHVFVSKSTLTKKFKNELAVSVHTYVEDVVLFEASLLVAKGSLPIKAISEQYGFCDPFYFSRRFSEKFSMSPREYRKLMLHSIR
ncbi:MAG: helix-turn-helix transcriptional regulator [Ruminococcaceae bacterium]|nr:helix-turn-helix transcriptional regulator [Oscillospiraceae bacterium]